MHARGSYPCEPAAGTEGALSLTHSEYPAEFAGLSPGGGCSGQLYDIDFCAAGGREGDRCYEFDGLTLYVDRMSYVFLIGTVVDWESSFIKTGFTLRNPNVTAACGCGESVAF